MASFPKDKNSPYHRVIFDRKIKGKRRSKTFYFRKTEFNRTEDSLWKKERELAYKADEWSPWHQDSHIRRPARTIEEVVREYKVRAQQELAESTYDIRRRYLEIFIQYVGRHRPIDSLSLDECNG